MKLTGRSHLVQVNKRNDFRSITCSESKAFEWRFVFTESSAVDTVAGGTLLPVHCAKCPDLLTCCFLFFSLLILGGVLIHLVLHHHPLLFFTFAWVKESTQYLLHLWQEDQQWSSISISSISSSSSSNIQWSLGELICFSSVSLSLEDTQVSQAKTFNCVTGEGKSFSLFSLSRCELVFRWLFCLPSALHTHSSWCHFGTEAWHERGKSNWNSRVNPPHLLLLFL